MADYKEQTISGTSWQRCWQILMHNPLGGRATIRYDEEQVLNIGGEHIRRSADSSGISYDLDPAHVIQLLDPDTLKPTGKTLTAGEVQQAIFSDYIQRAMARDTAISTPTE